MRVSDFDFDLPEAFIAQHPAQPRDSARLLVVGKNKTEDLNIADLAGLVAPGDVLVVNDTRVIPVRLKGRRRNPAHENGDNNGPRIEVTLLKSQGGGIWQAFARPARKLKAGDCINFAKGFSADVTGKGDGGEVSLTFALSDEALMSALERHGIMPLPPYIKRGETVAHDFDDPKDYQTMFAQNPGAVAAPTAGLHFTPDLLQALETAGAQVVSLTLHVGAGTFLPVKVDDTQDHKMHAEWGDVGVETAKAINSAKEKGHRIIAVGSTALRLLETATDDDGKLHPFCGETDIFITPGYPFRIVDAMLTNFHLPRSTLFMLVSAFSGMARMKAAYEHAKTKGYRFYSYGDACFLERMEQP
ncbi:MAG: tRNA preQ1(34) S-adenosylmethionine ribosyltransferase-isomerase QueA [Proteobacteria bacterium]|nr:tRNA preQ1(34) S-adenosylmethionine ribosyltransferase-isomerase QueA [Pseudomonadota bacterium]MDA1022561.1 tRNA preQ1(34) S-adenosylmethionine ribosyltransferase-isomerase QueA [Pseudomonadota bacterium]